MKVFFVLSQSIKVLLIALLIREVELVSRNVLNASNILRWLEHVVWVLLELTGQEWSGLLKDLQTHRYSIESNLGGGIGELCVLVVSQLVLAVVCIKWNLLVWQTGVQLCVVVSLRRSSLFKLPVAIVRARLLSNALHAIEVVHVVFICHRAVLLVLRFTQLFGVASVHHLERSCVGLEIWIKLLAVLFGHCYVGFRFITFKQRRLGRK